MSLTSAFRRFSPTGTRQKWPLPPPTLELKSARLHLRIGQPRDWNAWHNLRKQSQEFLKPWEPTWPPEALSFDYFANNLRRQWREWKEGQAYTFLIFLKNESFKPFSDFGSREEAGNESPTDSPEEKRLVGGISLSMIERGAAQHGRLGYWIGAPYARQGLMSEAARLVIEFAFETLLLHRLDANCKPDNTPSRDLLVKLGFEEEGFAKSYLRINGVWEDHILWGLIKEES